MEKRQQHRLSFPAVLLGSWTLAFGPWFVRVADTGPVAAAFWRMALGLPFIAALAWRVALNDGVALS